MLTDENDKPKDEPKPTSAVKPTDIGDGSTKLTTPPPTKRGDHREED